MSVQSDRELQIGSKDPEDSTRRVSLPPASYDETTKTLSISLFQKIKPISIELSNIGLLDTPAFNSQFRRLAEVLESEHEVLDSHYKENTKSSQNLIPYHLSPNLADYIFFPLSNILKQPAIDDRITTSILKIIGFLVEHIWSYKFDEKFVDELLSIVLFLSGANSSPSSGSKPIEFRAAAVDCLAMILKSVPNDYFVETANVKRMSLLGNSISFFLDNITWATNPRSQEENNLLINNLDILVNTATFKMSSDQLAHVLPGMVSNLTNFFTQSKNLHYTVIVKVVEALKVIIIKVFNDKTLNVSYKDVRQIDNLEAVNELWSQETDEDVPTNRIKIEIPSKTGIRNTAWLQATSKQLKLSLIVFFKTLLVTSSNNKSKVQTKNLLAEAIYKFSDAIMENSFLSLFNEVVPLSLDMLATTISLVATNVEEENTSIANVVKQVGILISANRENCSLFFNQIKSKLDDLITNKLTSVILSVDDEKINSYLVCIKLHLSLLNNLSKSAYNVHEAVSSNKKNIMVLLSKSLKESYIQNSQQKDNTNDLLKMLSGSQTEEGFSNKLDNVELPPNIDSKKITKIRPDQNRENVSESYSSNLMLLSNKWSEDSVTRSEPQYYFSTLYSNTIEEKFAGLIQFIAALADDDENEQTGQLELVESLFDEESEKNTLDRGIALWVANNFFINQKSSRNKINMNDYIILENDSDEEDELEEMSYLLVSKSQDLINDTSFELANAGISGNSLKVNEMSYSIALDTIGILSSKLPLEEFRSNFLRDFLYSLLEALTFRSNTLIQSHAQTAVGFILKNYYNDSLESLILDNSDYLIDNISLRLTVPSNFVPTLPGILLIIIKVAGQSLLEMNQLNDVLSEMFVIIDSYHGYSIIVEGLFMVFEEVTKQVKERYLSQNSLQIELDPDLNTSSYKPWGLTSVKQVLKLLSDSAKLTEPFESYDSTKEYFKRKPDTPFSEQAADSDDDDDDEQEPDVAEEEKWPSPVPENTYFLVQRIFNYGFVVLSQKSTSMKLQVLKTLKQTYPILTTNYKLVLVILTKNWPILLTLISGSSSLSVFQDVHEGVLPESEALIVPALEFVIEIVKEDGDRENFLGNKFIESWEFLINHSPIFGRLRKRDSFSLNSKSKQISRIEQQLTTTRLNPKVNDLLVTYLITGLNCYERTVSDLVRLDIVRVCYRMGIPSDMKLSRDVRNTLWIVKNEDDN
ncbi:predicted protein [Scheffersomyces stipitis CBS 6054]|uniref:TEL2-interacting protein 1 n=1 Tax=Scheffersomyces stipitis (strain ATCC 58785 / CBS 6054 / NBRC 10063 / NRRL Y-11545) TaxID=322104 RepID=A3LRE4_PICST|nr:predicted protein [Scheffersomyces stipitis CBS 6054]ABN65722.2 predicted protein [Scheffersomyces stipitis CBS 6054]